MNWTPQLFKEHTIISALLPYDNQQTVKDLLGYCKGYEGVAVLPAYIKLIREGLPSDEKCKLIGVSGFPTGGVTSKTKITEIRELYYHGADRFDVTINTGFVLSGLWEEVECDLYSAARAATGKPIVVSLEIAYLQQEHIRQICKICEGIGVEAVSTTSGWLPRLPKYDEQKFLRETLDPSIKMQAAGIMSFDQFLDAVNAGADRFMIRYQHAEAILTQFSEDVAGF